MTERRPYFILGDLFASAVAGMAASLAVRAIVSSSWHVVLAAAAGMMAGTLVAMLVSTLFMPLFGAFEVMLPAMLAGMLSGTIAGMIAAMGPFAAKDAALYGALMGLLAVSWVYVLTAWERRQSLGSEDRA